MAQEKKEADEMEYRLLGGTGLKVSVLGFGCMTFQNVDQAVELLSASRKVGINFFDNAEVYGNKPGEEETIFGKAYQILLKKDPILWRRSDVVITTKLFWGGSGENEIGLSQKHISEGIDASLKRLQLDYVDVLFAHRPDLLLPSTEEVVRAFSKVIRDGKASYWGTSEWPAHKIVEACWIAKIYNLIPPIVEQPQYNMLFRDNVEYTLNDLYLSPYSIGLTTWSPLHGGFLTGKYIEDDVTDETRANVGGFIAKNWQKNIKQAKAKQNEAIKKLKDYAEKTLKSDLLTLALAWVIKNKNVSTMLLGASKASQIEQNVKCLQLARELNEQNLKDIDEILANKPIIPVNPRRTLKKTF